MLGIQLNNKKLQPEVDKHFRDHYQSKNVLLSSKLKAENIKSLWSYFGNCLAQRNVGKMRLYMRMTLFYNLMKLCLL